jgi:hypothetical protein
MPEGAMWILLLLALVCFGILIKDNVLSSKE